MLTWIDWDLEPLAVPGVLVADHAPGLVPYVGEKHYQRKHGKNAYYGQGGL